MFRQFANPINTAGVTGVSAEALISLPPSVLTGLLELAWNNRVHIIGPQDPGLGSPDHRSNFFGLSPSVVTEASTQTFEPPPPAAGATGPGGPFAGLIPINIGNALLVPRRPTIPSVSISGLHWHHLIYAYMIENTRIYEIFRRVVHEYLHGEKLGVPSPETQLWLRNTVELFYRDGPPFVITTIDSHIRSDLRASRRNAYQRMFGMDLNHGMDDNTPYSYLKAEAANNEFVRTIEELLREVWIGIVNENNLNGAKATDDAKIANLTKTLHDIIETNANSSRERLPFCLRVMSMS